MSPDPMLDGLRRDAEERMAATCEISRVTGETFDENTGRYTQTVELRNPSTGAYEQRQGGTSYDHPCTIRVSTSQDRVVEVAEDLVTLRLYEVKFKNAVEDVQADDVVTVTGSPDAEMVGKALRVRDFPADDFAVYRLVLCEEQL